MAAGSGYGASERIDRVMDVIGDDPVLWVDVKTTTDDGYYASEHMRLFNQALTKAHARHPTLEVFQWSEVAQDSWFTADGIHYTSTGYAYRAALIAAAVAEAFPADDWARRSRNGPSAPRRRSDAPRDSSRVQMLPAPRMVSIIRRMPSPVRCMAS